MEKTGDLAGARDALEASLKLTPEQFPARVLLGEVYLGLKDPKAAEDQFEARFCWSRKVRRHRSV